MPTTMAGLNQADFISFDNTGRLQKALNDLGLNLSKKNFPLISENYIVHWELVKKGLGIGVMPADIGDAEPLVQPVLKEFALFVFPMWLTAHSELKTSRRVRIVFDLLVSELSLIIDHRFLHLNGAATPSFSYVFFCTIMRMDSVD